MLWIRSRRSRIRRALDRAHEEAFSGLGDDHIYQSTMNEALQKLYPQHPPMYLEAAERDKQLQMELEEERGVRSVDDEPYAAMDDPTLDEGDLQELMRRAEAEGVESDPGLRADIDFHAQRLARFWGEDRE